MVSQRDNSHKIDLVATAACLGTLTFWSLGPIFIKYLTGYVDSWTQNLLRYSVACVFLLPWLFYFHRTGTLDHRVWTRAIPPAAANVGMQSLWALSMYYADPGFLTFLTKSNILWIAAFSMILFPEERPLLKSWRFWLGLALCLTGVCGVMYFKVDFDRSGSKLGIMIGLATAFMWGLYVVLARRAFRDIDSRTGFSVLSLYTVGGLAVLAFWRGDLSQCLDMGAWQWFCVVISSVTAISLAHTFYYAAMRRIGATIPGLIVLAQPTCVLTMSYFVFHESMSLYQVFFGILLLVGAGLAIWAQQHLGRVSAAK